MAGLLMAQQNAQPGQTPANQKPSQNGGRMGNDLLQKIQDGIEKQVPAPIKSEYQRIVTAGMRMMYDSKMSKYVEKRIAEATDIPSGVANGIADMLALLYNESKRKMSIPAAFLASFSLMAEALDFLEKLGKVKVDNSVIDQSTQATWKAVTSKFGITQDKINQVIAEAQQKKQQGGASQEQSTPSAMPGSQAAQ